MDPELLIKKAVPAVLGMKAGHMAFCIQGEANKLGTWMAIARYYCIQHADIENPANKQLNYVVNSLIYHPTTATI